LRALAFQGDETDGQDTDGTGPTTLRAAPVKA
jgi:hypothetical protein